MNFYSLESAETLAQFTPRVKAAENITTRHVATVKDFKLYPAGDLAVSNIGDHMRISDKSIEDIARISDTPVDFFAGKCDSELRATIFNYRLPKIKSDSDKVVVVLKSGIVIRIYESQLLPAPRLPILDTLQNSIPSTIPPDDVRVIPYVWNGTFDLAVIARCLTAEPVKDDIVAFGVSVAEDSNGAVQIQGATFRLACSNGAMVRICQGNEHRLRRPLDTPNGHRDFLRKVRVFAQIAWEQWGENAEQLSRLPVIPIFSERFNELRAMLRQAPFFLSAGIVQQVLRRMVNDAHSENREPSVYDLWNSLSWYGTHANNLSSRVRYFLRIGAGELTKHKSKTCSACRQLVIS